MTKGNVASIYIATSEGNPMQPVDQIRAVPGRGLDGDRYFNNTEAGWADEPDREITLIESEAFEGMKRESGLDLQPSEGRRNIVTRGVALNHLVGREFNVGDVRLRGMRLCEPCSHLQKISKQPGILGGLIHRGGLRAQILSEGVIKVDDGIDADE
jgi:MOSC domain-containing protein YiiM